MSKKKRKPPLIDMTYVSALKVSTDKVDKMIDEVIQERLNNQDSERQSKTGQGNKGRKRRSTEILDEIIGENPKTTDEFLTLLENHESIYEVNYNRKQYTFIKKDGAVSRPVSFDSIETYLTNK